MSDMLRRWGKPIRGFTLHLILAFGCGALATLSLPPVGWLPTGLFLGWPLIHAMGEQSSKRALLMVGCAGWGWFFASLYWIASSLFVSGGFHLLLLPVVSLGLPLFLALFWAVAGGLAHLVSHSRQVRLIALCITLGGGELARSTLLTGFPWNVTGHIFIDYLPAAQMAAFVGQQAMNFIAIGLITGIISLFYKHYSGFIILCLPFVLVILLGGYRISQMPVQAKLADQPMIRLIQPNIAQNEKWLQSKRDQHLRVMIRLALQKQPLAKLVILPEAAINGIWPHNSQLGKQLARAVTARDGILVTGMLSENEAGAFFNSTFFLHHTGGQLGQYDKQHLVPFGEYVPIRSLPFIDAIAGPTDFSAGGLADDIYIEPYGYMRVLICYEIIFPGFIAADRRRPDMIINLSNDAWFGMTAGPHQHFFQARLRAIEEGISVYRVSNTGISGGFDGYGRNLGQTSLNQAVALDLPFIPALLPTFYSENRWLGVILLLIWFVLSGFSLEFVSQKRHKKSNL